MNERFKLPGFIERNCAGGRFCHRREHFRAAVIIGPMPRYAINPPVFVCGGHGCVLRSTEDAVKFVRAVSNPDDAAAILLVKRLENVRNLEIAQALATELRAWLERRGWSRAAGHSK